MDEKLERFFSSLDESEMSELLEDTEVPADEELSRKIKAKLDLEEKGQAKLFTLKKILTIAAAFVLVIAATVFFMTDSKKPQIVETTTQPTTAVQQSSLEIALLEAISAGNDSLVKSLIRSSEELSSKILSFAIEYTDVLSYSSIQDIAEAVYKSFGTTGLDSLLESTLLGDSKRALEELKKRENMLMTPGERLAFFFSVAFCDSEVVNEFIEGGYDINSTDESGNSVYEIAEKYSNEDNMEYVKEHGNN